MDPAEQLDGAEALLAQAFAKGSQPLEVEVEQVDRHAVARAAVRAQRLWMASAGKKYAISTAAVSGASEPCT
ncbi:MAG: hypothetical protein KDF63_01630, partial [Rhodoferax sp.]|nr:hypothetical protein [Rhodoferax sp.]